MREILFKAKRIDNGEWIEGHYTECRGETFIGIDTSSMFEIFCPPVIRWFKVDSETICQFTGLCDKNGKEDMGESCYRLEDIGKIVFLTREEAEKKLEELKNEI